MKLKLLKGPRPGQNDMVCHTDFGTYAVKVGDTMEVSDAAGHAIMAKWVGCFKMVKAAPKVKEPSPEKVAEAEANKMMSKGYDKKKV